MPKSDILDIITPDQALIVLKQLAVQDPKIKKKAREIAFGLVDDVDGRVSPRKYSGHWTRLP